jgi:hypothetical protein
MSMLHIYFEYLKVENKAEVFEETDVEPAAAGRKLYIPSLQANRHVTRKRVAPGTLTTNHPPTNASSPPSTTHHPLRINNLLNSLCTLPEFLFLFFA